MIIVSENRFSGKTYFYTIGSRGKGKEKDVRTVEEFVSNLGPETQKFLEESLEEGKSTVANMKTTAHLGPNFGKPGYSRGPPSPTKKQNQESRKLIPNSPTKKGDNDAIDKNPDSPIKKQVPGSPVKNRNQDSTVNKSDSPSKRPKPDSPVKKGSPTRVPSEDKSLATMTKRMQLPLVTTKKRSVGDHKDDPCDPDSFYREFKVQAVKALGDMIIVVYKQ